MIKAAAYTRFRTPRHVSHSLDIYGCSRYWYYGTYKLDGKTTLIKNPDMHWPKGTITID